MLLLFVSGLTENDSDDVFSVLPPDVQNIFTKEVWDAIERNDADYDPDKPPSDAEANKYFDQTLLAFERANPLLRRLAERKWAADYKVAQKATIEFEENASYAFEPTLGFSMMAGVD
ncbi:hypothetical protein BH20ACI2_BH20ACI2_21700 [soil metagenome]